MNDNNPTPEESEYRTAVGLHSLIEQAPDAAYRYVCEFCAGHADDKSAFESDPCDPDARREQLGDDR